MESLVKGHFDHKFDEDPERAMTRTKWEAIAQDSAKKAADARELLRLKKKEEGELRAKAKALAAPATPLQIMLERALQPSAMAAPPSSAASSLPPSAHCAHCHLPHTRNRHLHPRVVRGSRTGWPQG